VHASGGLQDAKGSSDVDIVLQCDDPNSLGAPGRFEPSQGWSKPTGRSHDGTVWVTYSNSQRWDRSVEVYVKADDSFHVAARHRAMELRLNALSPQLCSLAVANRLAGFKTEPAYYAALFPEVAVAYDDARAYAFLLQDWSRIELMARQRAEELSERAA
jgi:hypothetical protein